MLQKADIGYEYRGDPGEPSTGIRRLSVSDLEAQILTTLAVHCTVLELGTGLGVSTRAMARYAEAITTVDIDPWVELTIAPTLDVLDNVRCIADRNFITKDARFDLAFIDADHSTVAVSNDIAFCRSHMHSTGMIVCHDASYDHVRAAIPDDAFFIDTEHGLAIIPC